MKYHTLIETCKNVGLNVKRGISLMYLAGLWRVRRTTKGFSPVLSHGNSKQTKVKTKIINGSPAPVYKGLEVIECLQ